jgi:hypothetical protein
MRRAKGRVGVATRQSFGVVKRPYKAKDAACWLRPSHSVFFFVLEEAFEDGRDDGESEGKRKRKEEGKVDMRKGS